MSAPTRSLAPVTNALRLPGRALLGQGPAIQLPRAWFADDTLFVTHAEGVGGVLHGALTQHSAQPPFAVVSRRTLGASTALSAFVQAALAPTHAALVYVDITQGARAARIAFFDRSATDAGRRARSDVRLGPAPSTYPAVAYNPRLGEFGVVWSHDVDLHFSRFSADGSSIAGSAITLPNLEFTWSNGTRFVSTRDGWGALVRETHSANHKIVAFNAHNDVSAQPTILSQHGSPIESSLSWDGERFALAWSSNNGFFVMLQGDGRTEAVRIASREHYAGAPSLVFDGTNHVLVWGDNPGHSRVHIARINRSGALLSNVLFASHPTEHCYFAFVSVGGANNTVVVTYQVGQNSAYVAELTQ
ncbi:MAG: hypothetical protein Q8Q09_18430 [Deltaproteobacteria bacterium]|nr:hypothetical protein [Deltaproteobacteria bacterium]